MVLASCDDARSAAVVLGAVDSVWQPSGVPRHFGFAHMAGHRERGVEQARQALGKTETHRRSSSLSSREPDNFNPDNWLA
jgi:non-specific serine/threonine protein kinase